MLKTITIPERTRNIVLAVAVAAFAAMLTAFYVSNYKRHVQHDQQNVPVLVAKRKIDTGTPGREAVSKGLAAVETLPRRSVAPARSPASSSSRGSSRPKTSTRASR